MDLLSLLAVGDNGWGDELLRGLSVTLLLAFATAPLALVMSFLIAWAKHAESPVLRRGAFGYTTIFRSLPELLTIIIIYYQSQAIVDALVGLFSSTARLSLNAFAAGVIALTLVFSALGSEVVRAAYQAVGKGQVEAASALGLRRRHIFFKVVLPQMWRHAIPAFGNLWMILLKDTSLISVIAVNDLVRYANTAIASTKQPFFFYTVLAFIYIVLAYVSGHAQASFERRATIVDRAGG